MDQRGFTMVEFMVALGIVGILSGIAVVNFDRYKQKSYQAERMVSLRNMQTSFEARDDDARLLGGTDYRSTYKWYSSPSWTDSSNGGTKDAIVPGAPNAPDHLAMYAYERNPWTVNAGHWIQLHYVFDCRDGVRLMWYRRKDGHTVNEERYFSNHDSIC